jgi:cytochrome P450
MPDTSLFTQVLDRANRADPYPLYARLRETPVIREDDGTYIVSTYAEIRGLLHDPRLSSNDLPKSKHARTGNPLRDFIVNPVKDWIMDTHRPLIFRDPPDHTILRRLVLVHFTPERMQAISGRVEAIIEGLIGKMRGREEIDLVDGFSYPLPVTVICELLGIPPSDEPKVQGWTRTFARVLDPDLGEEDRLKSVADFEEVTLYVSALVKEKRKRPASDVLSGLATYRDKKLGRMGKSPRHRRASAGRRTRDHRQSHHQRHAHAATPSRMVGEAAPGPRARATRRR